MTDLVLFVLGTIATMGGVAFLGLDLDGIRGGTCGIAISFGVCLILGLILDLLMKERP